MKLAESELSGSEGQRKVHGGGRVPKQKSKSLSPTINSNREQSEKLLRKLKLHGKGEKEYLKSSINCN